MTRIQPTNIEVSIKAKLQNYAKAQNVEFQRVLTNYGAERFLYRLSKSVYRDRFVLKGATLFLIWLGQSHRPTRDLDFLGLTEKTEEEMGEIIREIIQTPVEPDGVVFLSSEMTVAPIREEARYGGIRIKLPATLDRIRLPIQIDIGFGDLVTPQESELTSFINLPASRLQIYPRESLIAEKFEAMVNLGALNSRLKDYYDIDYLLRHFDFDGKTLSSAITATFSRRKTLMPATLPSAFTSEFFAQPSKQTQWLSFLRNVGQSEVITLEATIASIVPFLMPVAQAVQKGEVFYSTWDHASLVWNDTF